MRRLAGAHQTGFRLQDHAVRQDSEMIGSQGRAGGGDIDNDIGGTRSRRTFGGAEAFHDAVKLDAMAAMLSTSFQMSGTATTTSA